MDSLKIKKSGFWIFNVPLTLMIAFLLGGLLSEIFTLAICFMFSNGRSLSPLAQCVDVFPIPGIILLLPLVLVSFGLGIWLLIRKYRALIESDSEVKMSTFIIKIIVGSIIYGLLVYLLVGIMSELAG